MLAELGGHIWRADWRCRRQSVGGGLFHRKAGIPRILLQNPEGAGPAAPLGRLDYVIEEIMIGGFAFVAVPAEYRVTGVKTFIVSNDGILYQKDLGPDSLNIVKKMDLYNADSTWQPTDDEWPPSVGNITAEGG